MEEAEKALERDQGQKETVMFSIIIPVYNAGTQLKIAVQSVLSGQYTDFELILVDDGSTDGSSELCNQLALSDPRIHVWHQKNQGQIAARECGVLHASGRYVLFLDADDAFTQDALLKISKVLESETPDMILYEGWLEEGGKKTPLWPDHKETGYIDPGLFRTQVIQGRRFNQIWLKAFRLECISGKHVSGPERNIRIEEDLLMQLSWFDGLKKIYCLPEKLYCYRPNKGSITQHVRKNSLSDIIIMHRVLYFYALRWQCPEARKYCNTRFLEDVISYAKLASHEKNSLTLYHQIASTREIQDIFDEKWDNLTNKQRIFLRMLLCFRLPGKNDIRKCLHELTRNKRSIMQHPENIDGVNLEWWDYQLNFGDSISPMIVSYAKDHKTEQTGNGSKLLSLGSILGMEAYDACVWGSGIHTDESASNIFRHRRKAKLDLRAVRGPVTAAILKEAGYSCPDVFGDPAILLPWICPSEGDHMETEIEAPDAEKPVLLIRHYLNSEEDEKALSAKSFLSEIKHLDIRTSDFQSVIQSIQASGKVISSSLHGLIVAECYGVPAVFLREGMEKEDFKYLDWYLSTGRHDYPAAASLEEALLLDPAPLPDKKLLDDLRNKLLDAFPADLWENK